MNWRVRQSDNYPLDELHYVSDSFETAVPVTAVHDKNDSQTGEKASTNRKLIVFFGSC